MEKNFNKTELTKICRHILYNTDRIVEKKYETFLMKYIFPYHIDWERKQGCGIDHIEVGYTLYGSKCFFLVRKDRTRTDISFTTCITYSDEDYRYKFDCVKSACRNAIHDVISLFKESIDLPYTCPMTGEVLYSWKEIHIDHYDMKFKDMFLLWIKDKDIEALYKKTLSSSYDNSTQTYFDDEELIKDFIQFHNSHTHLRAVSKKYNLSNK